MVGADLKNIENRWRVFWEEKKIYSFDRKTKKKIYSIDTPPPTVSGKMHIGHALSYSQQDFIARYKRMKGFEVFYPFGTDDNGLPTEKLVEKLKNVRSKEMTRTDFIDLCLDTLKDVLSEFVQDWKDIGMSCDFDLYYSTINKSSQIISQKSFLNLYKQGEIYREQFPTLYCSECQTPIAQAELEDKSKSSKFNTIRFFVEGKDFLIATTRPELIGACVAIFVNPKDERFKKFIGKKAKTPLYEEEVLIVGDDSASMEKGTGALMICSYGDKYDVDAIKRHKLKPKIIFDIKGRMKDSRYFGLTIKQARTKILEDLQKANLLVEQKDIEHVVNVHERCGTEIEFLPVEQWFVKILDKKRKLIENGRKIKWRPEFMFKRYENWINGLEWDWSISRERHFGIPIPVWICSGCNHVIPANEKNLPVDPVAVGKIKCGKCGGEALPETKVLDTWATSSLTPQITSELSNGKVKIPFSLRPQGHDIIRTWAFYTIVKTLLHENKLPWKEIAISGFVTLGGQKMSKSKGNVIDPRKVMSDFGADALRYWAASPKLGEDVDYMEKDLVTGKKLVTKLLNAAKFVFLNLNEWNGKKPAKITETDRLFLSKINEVIESCTEEFDNYNYSRVRGEVDNLFWKVFADNYLEIVKKRVYNGTKEEKDSAFWVLYQGLFAILKLYAPFVPFVTEEIYQCHFRKFEVRESIHLEKWPSKIAISMHKYDSNVWGKMIEIIGKVRQAKSELKVAMNAPIKLSLTEEDLRIVENVLEDLKGVCVAKEIVKGAFRVELVRL